MLQRKTTGRLFVFCLSLALIVLFHNCSPKDFKNSLSGPIVQESGNGGAYEGKLTRYDYYDHAQPCSEVGANLKPLPNKEIFLSAPAGLITAELVRERCQDLSKPSVVPLSDLQFANDGTGKMSYQGQDFFEQNHVGDFDVVAANCPAGQINKAGGVRQNLLASSQSLLSSPWFYQPGVQGSLIGSLGSLPKYQLQRTDPNALEWYRRVHQEISLKAGTNYALTFFAQKGSVNEVYISGWHENNMALNVYFDLNTGAGRDVGSSGFSNVSFASRAFSGGQIVTVYFTAPISDVNYLGITPAPPAGTNGIQDGPMGSVGDSISATALQLEDLSAFCTKL